MVEILGVKVLNMNSTMGITSFIGALAQSM